MKRLVFCLILWLAMVGLPLSAVAAGQWETFRDRFIRSDGRVVDPWQKSITHSEGQGYAMLLAVAHGDRETFVRLWAWTKTHLQVRKTDHLLAWSWGRLPVGIQAPLDFNNASDGDLCVAWALLRAREKWNRPEWEDAARVIIADLRRLLVLERYGHTVLLPGYTGFVGKDTITVNPSYWVLPAFPAFARVDDPVFWQRVHDQALILVREHGFGPMHLPPDWMRIGSDGRLEIDPGKPPEFGYEAIRVFLWAALDGSVASLPGVRPLLAEMNEEHGPSATINLKTGKRSGNRAPAGFLAVGALCARQLGERQEAHRLQEMADELVRREKDDYYSQALYLLAAMRVEQQ